MTPLAALEGWLEGRESRCDGRFFVAFSGGLDSHVLLHALATLRRRYGPGLVALHVDHALDPRSREWSRHCAEIAASLGVPLIARRIEGIVSGGDGLEAAARDARYRWFRELVRANDVLLTAHHRGDQAETLLYNLLRGAGTRGIAAMPAERAFSSGILARPFLDLPRVSLKRYAVDHDLQWIDDPANERLDFDRNFVRHRLMPLIFSRWPAAEGNLARASLNAADAQAILDQVALRHIAESTLSEALNPLSGAPVLNAAVLRDLSPEEFSNAVRRWVADEGFRAPSRRRIGYLREALVVPSERVSGRFAWDLAEIHRYRDALYLFGRLGREERRSTRWRVDEPLAVAGTSLALVGRNVEGANLSRRLVARGELSVDWCTGDRKIRTARGGPRKSLRKLFQEAGVPPFMRRVLPRIVLGDDLICVPGVVESADFLATADEPGIRFEFVRREG